MEQQYCTVCHLPVFTNYFFCPNCGKQIHEPPLSTTIGKQIGIYALSVLLPPFGLYPAFKYLRQENQKAKIIGVVAIVLTILSIVISIWLAIDFTNKLYGQLNSQMNQYPGLGL